MYQQRFIPSEFGTDPARMGHAIEPGRVTFDDKMVVRKAIEEAKIPFTYISANCFAGYFLGGLCQPGYILPSRDSVTLLGDGNKKGITKSRCMSIYMYKFIIYIYMEFRIIYYHVFSNSIWSLVRFFW